MADSKKYGEYKERIRLSKTKFKYVSMFTNQNNEIFFRAYHSKYGFTKDFDNERDAAIAIDKLLLNKGLSPINILKRK